MHSQLYNPDTRDSVHGTSVDISDVLNTENLKAIYVDQFVPERDKKTWYHENQEYDSIEKIHGSLTSRKRLIKDESNLEYLQKFN